MSEKTESNEEKVELTQKEKEKIAKKKEKEERKQAAKEERRNKNKAKQEEIENKIWKLLHDQFYGILDKDKLFYTIEFFVMAVVIAIFSLGPQSQSWPKTATNVTTMIFALGFIFLMIFALIPNISKYMFDEKNWLNKIIISAISFGIGIVITALYYHFVPPGPTTVKFTSPNELLPAIFIVTFFTWNLIQIWFIKEGLQNLSVKVDLKLIVEEEDIRKKHTFSIGFLIAGLITPVLLTVFTIVGFLPQFSDPSYFGGSTTLQQTALNNFWTWNAIVFIIIAATSYWQIQLYIKSLKHKTPNVFSNMFYILIWLIFWFRSFGFIQALRSATQTTGSEIFVIFGNVVLLAFTSIMVLRGLAARVKISQVINEDALPFIVYALTIMYVSGQVVMILGGFGSRNQVNLLNNALILFTSVIFYFWYSNNILQRQGYIQRNSMTIQEVKSIVFEYSKDLKEDIAHHEVEIERNLSKILEKYSLTVVSYKPKDKSPFEEEITEKTPFPETEAETEESEAEKDEKKDATEQESTPVKFESEDEIALDVSNELGEKSQKSAEDVKFDSEKDIEKSVDESVEKKTQDSQNDSENSTN